MGTCLQFQKTSNVGMQFSGHCWRGKNEIVSQLLRWEPKHGKTLIDQLECDTGLTRKDHSPVMANRREWDRLVKTVRAHPK